MLFATDLDNTIIHSYKISKSGDVCVETKDGKQLSFMAPGSYEMFNSISQKCSIVPFTTRSLEQYRRIDLGFIPPYAIVAHGAILLVDGQVDDQWISETRELFEVNLPRLSENEYIFDIRYVDDFFVFAKSEDSGLAVHFLRTTLDEKKLSVCAVHNKVYVFPAGLNKGMALERLKKRVSFDKVICAGDSLLDIPMLKIADYAIVPSSLRYNYNNAIVINEKQFVNLVLPTVSYLLNRC
jgi:hydroxymethylpyrimidine pyrophosphatase-like HAD family hydrolase